jgi:hypothetical protein
LELAATCVTSYAEGANTSPTIDEFATAVSLVLLRQASKHPSRRPLLAAAAQS